MFPQAWVILMRAITIDPLTVGQGIETLLSSSHAEEIINLLSGREYADAALSSNYSDQRNYRYIDRM